MLAEDIKELEVPLLDFNNPAVAADPFSAAREMSKDHWIARTPSGYIVFNHKVWTELAKNPSVTTPEGLALSTQGIKSRIVIDWASNTLLGMQGEKHDRVRRVSMPSFSTESVEGIRDFDRGLIRKIYEPVIGDGYADVAQLNNEYVTRTICRFIGYPDSDWKTISRWADDANLVVSLDAKDHIPRIEKSLLELNEYTKEQVERARNSPGDNLATKLVFAEQDGEKLSGEEVINMLEATLMAGAETSTRMLTHGMYLFAKYKDYWRELAEKPDLAKSAVEELLRFRPAFLGPIRVTTDEVVFNGVKAPKGTTLMLCTGSANFDESVFEDPTRFDLHRYEKSFLNPNHLGFGAGFRICIGRVLARVELQEAFKYLPGALGEIEINETDDCKVKWSSPLSIHGPTSLPLKWKGHFDR